MRLEFRDIEEFLAKISEHPTKLRVYCINRFPLNTRIRAVAQSVKNTFVYEAWIMNEHGEKQIEEIESLLAEYDFTEVKEIQFWEG